MIVVIQTRKLDSNLFADPKCSETLGEKEGDKEIEKKRERERERLFQSQFSITFTHTHRQKWSHSECHHLKQSLVIKAGQLFCCCCLVFSVWSAVVSWCCAGLVVDTLVHLFQVLMKVVMIKSDEDNGRQTAELTAKLTTWPLDSLSLFRSPSLLSLFFSGFNASFCLLLQFFTQANSSLSNFSVRQLSGHFLVVQNAQLLLLNNDEKDMIAKQQNEK